MESEETIVLFFVFCAVYFDVKTDSQMPANRLYWARVPTSYYYSNTCKKANSGAICVIPAAVYLRIFLLSSSRRA